MKAIKIDYTGAVLIDTNKGFNVWMDIYKDCDELYCDWNQYIFHLNNPLDLKIKKFQEDVNNFDICSDLAIDFYIKHTNVK